MSNDVFLSRDLNRVSLLLVSVFFVLSLGAVLVVFFGGTYHISKYLYVIIDFPGFVVFFSTAFFLAFVAVLPPVVKQLTRYKIENLSCGLVAFVTLVFSVVGVHWVYHGYALSVDEWMTRLQAEIFLSGHLSAVLPEEWRAYGRGMFPGFAAFDPSTGTLASNYRPGMSLIYAGFQALGIGLYSSAILNSAAVLLVARIARQTFPNENEAPIVASLLLATSQQALAASLTSYAMSAHLCFNLLWLTLFLNDRWLSHILAAIVGVITVSLHQVHFHFFFALPFLLTIFRPFRASLLMLYVSVYVGGYAFIASWDWYSFNSSLVSQAALDTKAVDTAPEVPGILVRAMQMARFPTSSDIASVSANLVRLIAWQSLALLPLLIVGRNQFHGNRTLSLLIWSFGFSVLPYPFLMPDQGHGWGYRYLHGLLGHLALLAVPGWILLSTEKKTRKTLSWVIACLLISPFALIPFRGWQIERFVDAYARGTALTSEQDSDVVIVNDRLVFIGQDIPRNSPTSLTRPIQLSAMRMTPEQISTLCEKYSVVILGPEKFAEVGIQTIGSLRQAEENKVDLSQKDGEREQAMKECNP